MSSYASMARAGAVLLLAGAALGLGVSLYAYFVPLTGVTATLGALTAILVNAVLVVCAVLLARLERSPMHSAVAVLTAIALAGNAFAGALLHEWWLCVAMAIGLAGLVVDTLASARAAARVRS